MRRLLTVFMLLIALPALTLPPDAEAARFGRGKSVGMKRKAPEAQPAPPAQAQAQQPGGSAAAMPQRAQPAGASRWLGPLAGFGLGALLATMFGGSALMGAIVNVLMVLLLLAAAMYVINMLRRRANPAAATRMQYAGVPGGIEPGAAPVQQSYGATPARATRYPDGFDVDGFVRQAKVSFMHLQAANDAKDLRDIRDYVTPQLYAELAMQMQERGDSAQRTDVVTLEAELLDVAVETDQAVASVRFTGLLREEEGDAAAGANPIDETWHVVKDLKHPKATWLIAGIEQNA